MSNTATLPADALNTPEPPSTHGHGSSGSRPNLFTRIQSACQAMTLSMRSAVAYRRRQIVDVWLGATPGGRAGLVAAAIFTACATYYLGTIVHDYIRQSKYSHLASAPKPLTGFLPDKAKVISIDQPLDVYVDELLLKDSLRKPASTEVDAEALRNEFYNLPSNLYPHISESVAFYMTHGRSGDDAAGSYRSASKSLILHPTFSIQRFEDDTSSMDGPIDKLVLIKLADGTIHAKVGNRVELSNLDDLLHHTDMNGIVHTTGFSSINAEEQNNLTGLSLRMGTSSQRAFHNLASLFNFAVNIVLFSFMGYYLWAMSKGMKKEVKFIMPSKIKGSMHDLIGMDDIKAEVLRAQDFLNHRERYKEYGIERQANILFSGPPGTGKTKLAGYLAKALDLPILFHSAANLETGFVNGGSQTLETALAMAKKHKRCVIFLDEAQDLFMKRGQSGRKFDDDTQNTLLSILDGVRTSHDSEVIWIVASNFNSVSMDQDEAMLRRFPMKVDFRLPNPEERRSILGHYLSKAKAKLASNLDLEAMVHITEGSSPADLEEIVREAAMDCGSRKVLIDTAALNKASERMLIGNTDDATTAGRDEERALIALHEAGHFLTDAMRHCGGIISDIALAKGKVAAVKISLKANARSGALGFVLLRPSPRMLQTKADLEWQARCLYGGMANEEIFYGVDGVTTGAYNDIQQATKLLSRAVRDMGMFKSGKINLSALDAPQQQGAISPDDQAIMERESQRLFDEAKAILEKCKEASRLTADLLIEHGEMSSDDLIDRLSSVFSHTAEASL